MSRGAGGQAPARRWAAPWVWECCPLCYAAGGRCPLSIDDKYTQEQARLAHLSRAQRFDELIEFPTRHLFKVIGDARGLSAEVRTVLAAQGFDANTILVERYSASKRHVSLSFELPVQDGTELDRIYVALEGIACASYVF